VYVANSGSPPTVSAYTIDATTGTLTPIDGSPFPNEPFPGSVTVDPTGRFVYVANSYPNHVSTVSAYTVDGTSGALTLIPGSPFTANSPNSVTVDPTGQFVYIASFISNSVSAYTIDGTTGALTPVPGSRCLTSDLSNCFPAGSGPHSVTVDPTGQFVYVANQGNGVPSVLSAVSAYAINATTGALTAIPGSPCFSTGPSNCFPAGPAPWSVAVDPTGQFVYVANAGGSVSAYTIDGITGALAPVPGSPCGVLPDPSNCVLAGNTPFSVTAIAAPPGPSAAVRSRR
jgi:6-phosphogluconolactonase (cycloisomerase 2 family)